MTQDPIFQTHEYAIGGKMVVGRAEMDESFVLMMEDGDETAIMQVKEKLTRDLVHFIMENRLVEFTRHDDPITMRRQLAIRAYLAPSDQVKILRLSKQI
ncbi:hypothetical protein UFOVP909_57 [uncultured Caudovirales phage]|uniref:Uncharacterized protein n=1 Tax=uncultured Caudovirales phage TaxID=2100421 RepID=A0A6J5PM68_9CAUD|nr:hypothetical protein UFOVP909_57 [uncultured Caudovirales phage]CAB4182313.1 hypothetical protein UFOVP1066_214 [uncultured Caudovirales phage]CAB4198508.1 hypothetical protein UFOVP1315_123 [uncultured Caudovirales phage]CAB4211477.1 hypothetical protein UFOVP1421_84 [uncultured Caudovirales phage]CAB5238590.1 hypothetical protein UFOVP1525_94 [uncultured Caudovirales phage]